MDGVLLLLILLMAAALFGLWWRWRISIRADYIRNYEFPPGIFDKLSARHPHLDQKDRQLVAQGLRQFYLAYLLSGRRFVSMPSQVADDLWHESILYTRNYAQFCRKAFGRFLHHSPAVVLSRNHRDNTGLRRVWWQCCKQEHLDPRRALRLPLLFALDHKLNIAGGFHYAADCRALRAHDPGGGTAYCGGDMADSGFDGTTDGLGDGDGAGGDGSGDGSGCGGGGCGGD